MLTGGSADDVTTVTHWDGTRWTFAPVAGPPWRRAPGVAFDSLRNRVVMFGGIVFTAFGDTWEWNGTSWAQSMPAASSSARVSLAMAYDRVRARTVLFGGSQSGAPLADTWLWDGTNWTRPLPTTSPSARASHAMDFDEVRGNVVLFGGTDAAGSAGGETWTWDGTTWSQQSPPTSPPGRYGHALAFDRTHGNMVLFGGSGSAGVLGDTWIWNGATWVPRSPTTSPSPRTNFGMAFDGAHDAMLLFGGLLSGFESNQTWSHTTAGTACSSNTECPTGYCTDGVCCNVAACDPCRTCAGTSPGRCSIVSNREDPDSCANRDGKSCSLLGECKSANGATAASASECASGFLVDGVCCDQACDGTCLACRADLKESGAMSGGCASAKAGLDVRSACAASVRETCGTDGVCDGHGACRKYVPGTGCGASACIDNRATGKLCDGAGQCADSAEGVPCGIYACRAGVGCLSSCTSNTDCGPRAHCDANGQCAADEGATCIDDHTLRSPTGIATSCGKYKCEGAQCKTSCARVEDCVYPAQCSAAFRCEAFQPFQAEPVSGCTCAAHPTRAPWVAGMFAAGFALMISRARRSRARRDGASL